MYFGAISTDIKKSSTLWMNFPAWMKNAVRRTNNVTEYVFGKTKTEGIEQKQLPNSPEGDAYTFFYQCEDQDKLIKHVKRVGHILQNVYKTGRDKNILKMKNKEEVINNISDEENLTFVMSEEFYQAVFVRVGVAFSDIAPIEYKYELESFTPGDESYENVHKYTSYWESVIAESERAEAKGAPYKDGIGLTQENAKVIIEPTTDENSSFELDMVIQGDPIKVPIERLAYTIPVYDRIRSTEKKVNGYMIFIHYKLHIQWDDVQRDPHLYQPMVNEFRQVHDQTKETMQEDFPAIRLVKVKRSADSMFFMPLTINEDTKKIKKPKPSDVWTKCLQICSHLPTGSSIGICYTAGGKGSRTPSGKLNKLTDIEPFEKYNRTDFFGDCVNLAARMAGVSWCYQTGIFKSGKNDHHSRVAMCNAEQTSKGWGEWKLSEKGYPGAPQSRFITPLKLEDIPRKTLNAGTGFLRTISAHVFLGQNIQVGDTVKWCEGTGNNETEYTGKVIKIQYLFAFIEGFIGRKNITYLEKVKKPPLKQIAPALPKKEKQVLKGGLHSLKF